MQIFVVTHKAFDVRLKPGYFPIQVGYGDSLGILRDNQGDNISQKNKNYCELTAAYWMWKNSTADIIGLEHYRRYFVHRSFLKKYFEYAEKDILSIEEIKQYLMRYDIIVPTKLILYNTTVQEHYEKYFKISDYLKCREIINRLYPEYLEAFDEVSSRHGFYPYNMMITRKELFNRYHEWLFTILFELEKVTNLSGYDDYQKRIYGFLSERLFNVWLVMNSYSVCEIPVINTNTWKEYQPVKNKIRRVILRAKNKKI